MFSIKEGILADVLGVQASILEITVLAGQNGNLQGHIGGGVAILLTGSAERPLI